MKKTSFIHVRLYDGESFIPDAFVVFGDTVEAVGWMKDFVWGNDPVVDLKGQWVIPSFVIGHTHVYSLFARGLSLPFSPRCFTDILDQLWWKMDRQLDPEMIRQSGISAAAEFLLHGVTTIVDHHASVRESAGLSVRSVKDSLPSEAYVRFCALRLRIEFQSSIVWPKTAGFSAVPPMGIVRECSVCTLP
jgi:cytosine/adenosine deaminase-related metal-dependent hydrolase